MRKVLVFGTFDLLHEGHYYFLRKARKKGDFLIAVVSRDSFVKSHKLNKPWYSEQERMNTVKESGLADKVVLADEIMGEYQVLLNEQPDLVCLGFDQSQLGDNLKSWIKKNKKHIKIHYLKPFKKHKFKSSVIKQKANRLELVAFLGAVSMFFSTIEYLFPRPVPFMRLGLGNIPIIVFIYTLNFRELMLLALIKVLGQGLVNGTLSSYVFLFSISGTFTSVFFMYGGSRLFNKRISFVGISILGAFVSNLVQSFMSVKFIFGTNSYIIIPYFMTMGLLTGALIGIGANYFYKKSLWIKKIREYYGA